MSLFYNDEENRPKVWWIALAILAGLGLIVTLVMWPFAKTPRDKIGLSYGGGVVEGAHFQGIHDPGSGLFFNGWGDRLYLYPTTQRNYIISKKQDEGDVEALDFVTAPSSDRIDVSYQVAVYFKLNLSKIKEFHENIGLKYQAWSDEGWDHMLADSFRQQIEFALQRESRKYEVAQLYADNSTLLAVQRDVGTVLKENVNEVLGDDYFCGPTYNLAQSTVCPDFTFVIKEVDIPESVRTAFQSNRTSEIEVLTRQNEVTQAKFQAEAIERVSHALDKASDQYVLLKAVESGSVDFWVVPQGQNLVLPSKG